MSDAAPDPRRAELASKLLVAVLGAIFLLGLLGFVAAVLDARDEPAAPQAPSIPDAAVESTGSARGPRILLAMAEPDAPVETSPMPGASASPDAPSMTTSSESQRPDTRVAEQAMPVAAVTGFWSKQDGLSRRDAIRALETGKLRGYRGVVIERSIATALAEELDIDLGAKQVASPRAVERAARRGALGFVAARDVSPRLRSLAIGGRSLVGNERVEDIGDWPLRVTLPLAEGQGWDHERTWVLVAGGDSFTDRGVYDAVIREGKGVDHPFDGGTARVTGHGCCDPVFNDNVVPRYVLTGNKGKVRKLFRDAELAIANHEQPVTEAASFHSSGTRFSGKPTLTKVFTRAGIDWLSLANNHIKDYGADGIRDTRRILRKHGIGFGGAGRDLEQARRISYLEAGATRLAIIPCLGLARSYWAGPDASGATPCLDRYLVPDIKAAKRRADVVIVFPHWGVEYTRRPLPSMRQHAARWAKAGADLILGGHSHVAGAIEDIDGSPVLYSLGNLIFDQPWSTNTMESTLLEATFHGDQLIELRLRPYIIHDASQPNLLDPAKGEGRRLLKQIRAASADWLSW